ncbi:hypothetical protein BASA81_011003 [Batrachochytrium salamandrivorans]|nr:hypothetical protein BASA81_011003 [Batrachochytrium salamandrivorans]
MARKHRVLLGQCCLGLACLLLLFVMRPIISPTANCHRSEIAPGSEFGPVVQMVHIPKTGGSFLEAYLTDWAHKKRYKTFHYAHTSQKAAESWNCEELKLNGLLFGHRHFGYCNRLATSSHYNQMVFVGVFRHPIARLVSEFDYLARRLDNNPLLEPWSRMDISQVVIDALSPTTTTVFTPGTYQHLSTHKIRRMCDIQTRFLAAPHISHHGQISLSVAIENLHRMNVVVVQEHMREQLEDQLRYVLGVGAQGERTMSVSNQINANPHQPSRLNAEALALVQECTQNDLQLYLAAVERSWELLAKAKQCLLLR